VSREASVERGLLRSSNLVDAAVEDVTRREEREAGVMMMVDVPREESLQPRPRVQHALEAARVVGLVLDCASFALSRSARAALVLICR
jgi:hypothetical protein